MGILAHTCLQEGERTVRVSLSHQWMYSSLNIWSGFSKLDALLTRSLNGPGKNSKTKRLKLKLLHSVSIATTALTQAPVSFIVSVQIWYMEHLIHNKLQVSMCEEFDSIIVGPGGNSSGHSSAKTKKRKRQQQQSDKSQKPRPKKSRKRSSMLLT